MSDQNHFELTISVQDDDDIKATSKGGAVAWGRLDFDPLQRQTVQILEEWLVRNYTVKEIDSWLVRNNKSQQMEVEVLGRHLFAAIFNGEPPENADKSSRRIPDLFRDQIREAEGKKKRLRLQLTFEGKNKDLIRYPWEFLYSGERRVFLATDVNLVLSRFIELGIDREPLDPQSSPLRILIVVSRPKDEEAVISRDVVAAIEKMAEDEKLPSLQVQHLTQPTLDSMETALKEYKPHILHFIGHGDFDEIEGTGRIFLIDVDGKADPCPDKILIETFKAADCYPRLVFLHMCEGGAAQGDRSALQAFNGFAPRLIHAQIPSVVAMRYPIKNKDAKDFSLAFYSELARGGSTVDAAVQEGRFRIDRKRRWGIFGTPVLYMHSSDGIIMKKQSDSDVMRESEVGPQKASSGMFASKENGAADERGRHDRDREPELASGIRAGDAFGRERYGKQERQGPDSNILPRILEVGRSQRDAMAPPDDVKFRINRLLFLVEEDFSGLEAATIGNELFAMLERETNEKVKQVLSSMIKAIP